MDNHVVVELVLPRVAEDARYDRMNSRNLSQATKMPVVGVQCRFTPTCSRYAEAVIVRDGVARGGVKALRRIARCGPWTARGTRDEP
jgi:putative membrane protein insertion efficiency factor